MTTFYKEVIQPIIETMPKSLYALIAFVILDYISGICVAIKEQKLSSKIGAKGIAAKVMIFVFVILSFIIDQFIVGGGSVLSSVTILFYCSNELISILENANRFGIPLPKKLKDCLSEFTKKNE